MAQKPLTQVREVRGEEGEKKGVDQRDHQQQFEASMPVPEARGLHSEFSLGKTISHFDLPATHVEKDDLPGVVSGLEGFIRLC